MDFTAAVTHLTRSILTARHLSVIAIFVFINLAVTTKIHAFTPTPQQLAQFQSMSAAEQKALASSMGIDINDISGLIGDNNSTTTAKSEPVSGPRQAPIPATVEQNHDSSAEMSMEAPTKSPLFGHDLFSFGADSFLPASDIPTPADYVLGPGDTLNIQLYGKESANHSLSLNRDGTINFPDIGPIALAGLSYERAIEKINEIVSEQMIGIKASITMGSLRTIRIFVLGEVKMPGSYVVGSLSTMTNAIFASGGIAKIGSLRNIQLKRSGKIITSLDLYDLLLKGDTSGDSRLLPGDVIFVPPVGKTATIQGAIKRPATYELKTERNAAQLIALAGGLSPRAYLPSSTLERISRKGEKQLVDIKIDEDRIKQIALNDADILNIASTLTSVEGSVSLSGHVKREENLAWRDNLHFTDLIPNPESLLALPDLDLAIIQREAVLTREISVISFSPALAFNDPKSNNDPALQRGDKIILFGYENDRSEIVSDIIDKLKLQANFTARQKTVRIDGSVRFPGEYPVTIDMSAKDLILLAGGFTESALGRDAEITRYEINDNRERVVLHIKADLNSEDPIIQAGDTLRVQQIPLWTEKESVTLKGEFLHPGNYALLPGETLIDVIRRAGGLTPQAFPQGAIFSRAELRALEAERLKELMDEVQSDIATSRLESSETREDIDSAQVKDIVTNFENTAPLGRMVIDLPSIIEQPIKLDFQLADGDVLEVPRFKPSITVIGEVQYATSHFFDEKLDANDYIERSGGLKRNADKKRIYVVKANGGVFKPKNNNWFNAKSNKLKPGDTIIIPLDITKVDRLTFWSSVTRIMSQTAIVAATLAAL